MDRDAIARAGRRRQAQEALEFERDRASGLEEQVEAIVAELEGPRIDQETFARMAPEDAEAVRAILHPSEEELDEDDWLGMANEPEDTGDAADDDSEEEIARLQAELTDSRRRQEVLARYLEALGA